MGRVKRSLAGLATCSVLLGSRCGGGTPTEVKGLSAVQAFRLDRRLAAADLAEWTKASHPFGSPRQAEVLTWLQGRLTGLGYRVDEQAFTAPVPNPEAWASSGPVAATTLRTGRNLYALPPGAGQPCLVALASHTDTKDLGGSSPYLGANDSGSSSVLLLQVLAYLQRPEVQDQLPCAVAGVFFDGEEAVLPQWDDGESRHPAQLVDHTYGSRASAASLRPCTAPAGAASSPPGGWCLAQAPGSVLRAVILLDMVGSPNLQLTPDKHSSAQLKALTSKVAAALGHAALSSGPELLIDDDHRPFLAKGVAAIDLIDFAHLEHWHQPTDVAAGIDPVSLELAGQTAIGLVLNL